MKIVILTLGKTSTSYLREGIAVYQDRLKHYAKVEFKELPDVPAKGISSDILKEREGELLLKHIKSDDFVLLLDENGEPVRIPGKLKAVKGIGWFIEEYGIAQISYNLTNINITSMHVAFDETVKAATERGLRVTGSELIGLIPLKAMLDAGDFFLRKQERSLGISEEEKIELNGRYGAYGETALHAFAVRGGLKDRAALDQFAAQRACVGQVAVVGDCGPAHREFAKEGLHIADRGCAF